MDPDAHPDPGLELKYRCFSDLELKKYLKIRVAELDLDPHFFSLDQHSFFEHMHPNNYHFDQFYRESDPDPHI